MNELSEKLNLMFQQTLRDINKLEEKMLHSFGPMKLSINEVHVIEAVGKGKEGKTISELAESLNITMPSVTNAVKKLETNGYVEKVKCSSDGRSVRVILTKLGGKIDSAHRYFHKHMVMEVTQELNEEEQEKLLHAIEKLDNFFKRKTKKEKYEF